MPGDGVACQVLSISGTKALNPAHRCRYGQLPAAGPRDRLTTLGIAPSLALSTQTRPRTGSEVPDPGQLCQCLDMLGMG